MFQYIHLGIENGDTEPGQILNQTLPQATLDTITDTAYRIHESRSPAQFLCRESNTYKQVQHAQSKVSVGFRLCCMWRLQDSRCPFFTDFGISFRLLRFRFSHPTMWLLSFWNPATFSTVAASAVSGPLVCWRLCVNIYKLSGTYRNRTFTAYGFPRLVKGRFVPLLGS